MDPRPETIYSATNRLWIAHCVVHRAANKRCPLLRAALDSGAIDCQDAERAGCRVVRAPRHELWRLRCGGMIAWPALRAAASSLESSFALRLVFLFIFAPPKR
jgi:hypothetical protein